LNFNWRGTCPPRSAAYQGDQRDAARAARRWPQDTRESAMGLGKKATNKAKAVKGKAKKDTGKVKHKGKKAKNAAKH
jgi:hypothetical protein